MKKDFSPLLRIPQMADCILIHDHAGGIVSDGIEWFTGDIETRKVPSHIEIYVGSGENKTIGARADGVRIHRIQDYFYDRFTVTVRRVKGIRVDQAAKVKESAYELVARKVAYNFTGLVGFALFRLLRKVGINLMWLPNMTNMPGCDFCSQVGDICYKSAHLDLFPELGEGFVSPEDFMQSERLETIISV